MLAADEPHVRFLLAGKGTDPGNRELLTLVRRAGLESRTSLLGERGDIPRLTAALDIATSCSRGDEAFSNAVGEAMASGVPCVVTDVGDSAWVIGDTGKVVRPRAPDDLVVAWRELIHLSEGDRQALGQAARKRVEESFSIEKTAARYEALHEEVLAGTAPAWCSRSEKEVPA